MPTVSIRNFSQFPVTNEVKMGADASGSCDPQLQHLGTFQLAPGQSHQLTTVADTTDFYWKNVKEYYWTHKTVWRFDANISLTASTLESADQPVDICDNQVKEALFSNSSFETLLHASSHRKSQKGNAVVGTILPGPAYTMELLEGGMIYVPSESAESVPERLGRGCNTDEVYILRVKENAPVIRLQIGTVAGIPIYKKHGITQVNQEVAESLHRVVLRPDLTAEVWRSPNDRTHNVQFLVDGADVSGSGELGLPAGRLDVQDFCVYCNRDNHPQSDIKDFFIAWRCGRSAEMFFALALLQYRQPGNYQSFLSEDMYFPGPPGSQRNNQMSIHTWLNDIGQRGVRLDVRNEQTRRRASLTWVSETTFGHWLKPYHDVILD